MVGRMMILPYYYGMYKVIETLDEGTEVRKWYGEENDEIRMLNMLT